MRTIEFNLDTYKRIESGELTGSVQTRRGTKVYVKIIDGEGEYPVIAQPEGRAVFYTYTIDGRIRANIDNEDDLVIKLKDKVMEQKLVKVPFEVELAKEISNGTKEGRIVTRKGDSVRILCWDKKDKTYPIVALVDNGFEEDFKTYTNEGVWDTDKSCTLINYNLMLEIPEYMTFKDGDVIAYDDSDTIGIVKTPCYKNDSGDICMPVYASLIYNDLHYGSLVMEGVRLATEEEKQKLITILKESKEPKAKEYLKRFFGIEQKQEYEFKPFDKVLVRYNDKAQWCARFFDRMFEGVYACTDALTYTHCIPYNEQTQHLHGTDKNWEE